MRDWLIVGASLAGTVGASLLFWIGLMPRLAADRVGRAMRVGSLAGYGLLLLALPTAGLVFLSERTLPLVFALVIGWALAVRATVWFAARRFFLPRLRRMREDEIGPVDTGTGREK